jgi:hypothetical protein
MARGLVYVLAIVFLFAFGAHAGGPALLIQSAQTLTDPGAFLLIGFGLLAIGAVGARRYKD